MKISVTNVTINFPVYVPIDDGDYETVKFYEENGYPVRTITLNGVAHLYAIVEGETKEQALIRECREELNVTVCVGDTFMEVVHEYPDLTVVLTLFHATIAEGIPEKLEHNDIRWITVGEIDQYEFCPADQEILERLKQL